MLLQRLPRSRARDKKLFVLYIRDRRASAGDSCSVGSRLAADDGRRRGPKRPGGRDEYNGKVKWGRSALSQPISYLPGVVPTPLDPSLGDVLLVRAGHGGRSRLPGAMSTPSCARQAIASTPALLTLRAYQRPTPSQKGGVQPHAQPRDLPLTSFCAFVPTNSNLLTAWPPALQTLNHGGRG